VEETDYEDDNDEKDSGNIGSGMFDFLDTPKKSATGTPAKSSNKSTTSTPAKSSMKNPTTTPAKSSNKSTTSTPAKSSMKNPTTTPAKSSMKNPITTPAKSSMKNPSTPSTPQIVDSSPITSFETPTPQAQNLDIHPRSVVNALLENLSSTERKRGSETTPTPSAKRLKRGDNVEEKGKSKGNGK